MNERASSIKRWWQHQQRTIQDMIAFQGFFIQHVMAHGETPDWSYTIGLAPAPDLCIGGLSVKGRVAWLLDLGFRVNGPPSVQARTAMAIAQRVPLDQLIFPEGGRCFEPGVLYRDLSEHALPFCFGEVDAHHIPTHFGQASLWYGDDTPCSLLQFVWTDRVGRFPWEPLFEQEFVRQQHLWFDPTRYLPLKEAD